MAVFVEELFALGAAGDIRIGISMGGTPIEPESPSTLPDRADSLLYKAKHAGGDPVDPQSRIHIQLEAARPTVRSLKRMIFADDSNLVRECDVDTNRDKGVSSNRQETRHDPGRSARIVPALLRASRYAHPDRLRK